jgi:peptidoglycan/LPS O-acetylase OafA/YrhL
MREDGGHDRLLYLDGLRAVAVLSVVAYHAWIYGDTGGPALAARALQMGAHGVDLFFVLSGFCLAYPYLRRFRAQGIVELSLATFAAKRIARIVPPYWLALLTIAALGQADVLSHPPPLVDMLKQSVFLDRDVHFAAAPFWTLPIEFRWYFLFPFALFAYLRAPRFVLASAVGAYVLYDFSRLNGSPDIGTLPAFLAGIWVADLYVRRSTLQRFALLTFLVYGFLAFALEPDYKHQFYAVEPLAIGALAAFVLLSGTFRPLRKILAHRALTTIGAGSYGIYLIHDPVLQRLETIDHITPWLSAITAVTVSLGFSLLCERPFVKGRARAAILLFFEARFATLAAWLGVPWVITLSAATHHSPDAMGQFTVLPVEKKQPLTIS